MMAWPYNPKCPSSEEASAMIDKIKSDGAYFNTDKKFSKEEQAAAVEQVNKLRLIVAGKKKWLD